LLFRQKWPKPLTPRLASFEGRDANFEERPNSQGSDTVRNGKERPSLGPAGRRRKVKYENFTDL
ncbi:MAG TPA: hypothetical protein PKK23_18695, partial [Nitrospirales bacterium]|nr:hypothetical protein [Nitrospirales bacterium]